MGFGEAVAPSAATDMIARVVPPGERARATSFAFGSLHVGSVLCLLIAPQLINSFGWQSVFFVFGGIGLVWVVWYEAFLAELARQDPEVCALLMGRQQQPQASGSDAVGGDGVFASTSSIDASSPALESIPSSSGGGHHGGVIDVSQPIPWRAFLRDRSIQALCFTVRGGI